jgi:hypothetical protein
MKSSTRECCILLESLFKRTAQEPASLSYDAGVPSSIIADYLEHGDFRHTPDLWMIERLLKFLRIERKNYLRHAFTDFSSDEILAEIKIRLDGG